VHAAHHRGTRIQTLGRHHKPQPPRAWVAADFMHHKRLIQLGEKAGGAKLLTPKQSRIQT